MKQPLFNHMKVNVLFFDSSICRAYVVPTMRSSCIRHKATRKTLANVIIPVLCGYRIFLPVTVHFRTSEYPWLIPLWKMQVYDIPAWYKLHTIHYSNMEPNQYEGENSLGNCQTWRIIQYTMKILLEDLQSVIAQVNPLKISRREGWDLTYFETYFDGKWKTTFQQQAIKKPWHVMDWALYKPQHKNVRCQEASRKWAP